MRLPKPARHLALQLVGKLCYLLQILVRHHSGHIVDGFIAFIAENLQLLYQLGICLDGQFQGFNDLGMVASLRDGAIAFGAKGDCCRSQCCSEAGDKTQVGGNCLYS